MPDYTDPFAKSTTPESEIDLSLFCHLLNDPFLAGTYQLQGNDFARTAYYLAQYCETTLGGIIGDSITSLINEIRYLHYVAKRLKEVTTEKELSAVTQDVLTAIKGLDAEGALSLPGGWKNPHDGHGMTYQFKKMHDERGECLLFTLYNSGAGLEYHERSSTKDKELYSSTQSYRIPLPCKDEELRHYLKALFTAQTPALRSLEHLPCDAVELYTKIVPSIHFLKGELVPRAAGRELLTAAQLSGTCAQRSLQQLLKKQFTTQTDYQRFIVKFKFYALHDYVRQASKNKHLHMVEVHALIKKATNSLLRIVNRAGLFTDAEKEVYRGEIKTILAALPAAMTALPPIIIPTTLSRNEVRFFLQKPPIKERIILSESSVTRKPPSWSAPPDCPGGESLIDWLKEHIPLLATKSPTQAMEWIEHLLVSFPLPITRTTDGIKTVHPFYQGLGAKERDELLEQLDAIQAIYTRSITSVGATICCPRQLVAGLSLATLVGELAGAIEPVKLGLRDVMRYLVQSFLKNNKYTPYYATKNPLLDRRLDEIRVLHDGDIRSIPNVIRLYHDLLASEPQLMPLLTQRFEEQAAAGVLEKSFAEQLRVADCKELYYFIVHQEALRTEDQFKPLLTKWDQQEKLEAMIHPFLIPFIATEYTKPIPITVHENRDVLSSTLKMLVMAARSTKLFKDRYNVTGTSALALELDHRVNAPFVRDRDDNQIQLFSCQHRRMAPRDADKSIVDAKELASRELFQLRRSPANQLLLTLEYFNKHRDKLAEENYQRYLEANLFQPPLLLDALEHPQFVTLFNEFIAQGILSASHEGILSAKALYYIRLKAEVTAYALKVPLPTKLAASIYADSQAFTSQLDGLLHGGSAGALSNGMRYFRFKNNMARWYFDERTLPTEELAAKTSLLVQQSLVDYLCLQQTPKEMRCNDNVDEVDSACIEHTFKALVEQQPTAAIIALLYDALPQIGIIGVDKDSMRFDEKTKRYLLTTKGLTPVHMSFDVATGKLYNAEGMTVCVTPLAVLQHPVMQYLTIEAAQSCCISVDGRVIEFGQPPTHRFIQSAAGYRVQRYLVVAEVGHWYELACFNEAQKTLYRIEAATIDRIDLPSILQERENQLWINTDPSIQELILTQKHQPVYRFTNPEADKKFYWTAQECISHGFLYPALNDRADTGGILTLTRSIQNWVYDRFSLVEDPQFITIVQVGEQTKVTLGRYGITLIGTPDKAGGLIFHLESDDKLILKDSPKAYSGLALLVFAHEDTKQQRSFLPVQEFLATDKRADGSEYYQLQQDIKGTIAASRIKGQGVSPCWQHSGSQRMMSLLLNEEGELVANTPAEALYLCYLYLGTHQPKKAWQMLEECRQRLGGLKGTAEELQLIHWIVNSLPKVIQAGEKKTSMDTPPYVACKLKAIALFTEAWEPGQKISLPPTTCARETPEDFVQEQTQKEIEAFYSGLNATLYAQYNRYQTMQIHLNHDFQLDDKARLSLLTYYHSNLPQEEPKAVGALGYEWELLRLKRLRCEYKELSALSVALGDAFPHAYRVRLAAIERDVARERVVYGHHTDIELVPIAMTFPKTYFFNQYSLVGDPVIRQKVVNHWSSALSDKSIRSEDLEGSLALLNSTTSDMDFFNYFAEYALLLTEKEPDAAKRAAQEKLLEFCKNIILTYRHTPIEKQTRGLVHGCHVLWRLYHAPDKFSKPYRCSSLFDEAKSIKLPATAQLFLWQACHKKTQKLADIPEMWAQTEELVSATAGGLSAVIDEEADADCSLVALLESLPKDSARDEAINRFRSAATLFGASPISPVDRDLSLLGVAEREQGLEQYKALQEMNAAAVCMVSSPAMRMLLQTHVIKQMSLLTVRCTSLSSAMCHFANRKCTGESAPIERVLDIESEARAPLDEMQLISLYLQADKAQYLLATGLTNEEVDELHGMIGRFLKLSVRKHALLRYTQLNKTMGEGEVANAAQCRKLMAELLTEDKVDYAHDPALAVMQYHGTLLLRKGQREAINALLGTGKPPFPARVEKMIMGGGKSKVIVPALARKKATGTNLVVVEVPPALLETNYCDLANTSSILYQQRVRLFQFNRDADCSPARLDYLYERLCDVIVHKDYLLTTGDAIQSLELKYLETLRERPNPANRILWEQKLRGLERLVTLFRTRADALIDEVHQGLELKKKLNYTVDSTRSVPIEITQHSIALYAFFDCIQLDQIPELSALSGQTLTSVLMDNHLLTTDESWRLVLNHFAQQLIHHEQSPLHHLLSALEPELSATDGVDISTYLSGTAATIPSCMDRMSRKEKGIIALYKEQVSQLLGRTLRRNLNEHYGLSHLDLNNPTAIPYVSNNTPSERSRFGNVLESVNLTIQMTLINGASRPVVKQYLKGLKQHALSELLANPSLGALEHTPTGKAFSAMVLSTAGDYSLNVNLDDDEVFERYYQKMYKNKSILAEVLQGVVLPHIELTPTILHSDAMNHVDLYRSCQGLTGTPSNSTTFHQRLRYNHHLAMATDGFIASLLSQKSTPMRPLLADAEGMSSSLSSLLARLFHGNKAEKSIHAIIDICARFKGISNQEVAQGLKAYINSHMTEFCSPPHCLKYILFFNQDNVLCALSLEREAPPTLIGSSDAANIDSVLGCSAAERFTYYDQAHTLGVDIAQASKACGMVLVDEQTTLKQFNQGCLRMRGLEAEQSLDIVVPPSLSALSFDSLLAHMAKTEETQLQEDNFAAAKARMVNLIRTDLMKRILDINEEDSAKKARYLSIFESFFIEKIELDLFVLYGGIDSHIPTRGIFDDLKARLVTQWSAMVHAVGEHRSADEAQIQEQLTQIIGEAERHCAAYHLSPQRDTVGQEVEIQQQVEVELERQMQLQREVEEEVRDAFPYTALNPIDEVYSAHPASYQTLNTLCAPIGRTAPGFSPHLYATVNYYTTYSGQRDYLDKHLKPVHALLFKRDASGALTCLIVSQTEAEELNQQLTTNPRKDIWLATTQHTVLAGSRPHEILSCPEYLSLIEQVRYFNGELDLLLDKKNLKTWLTNNPAAKLNFFEQVLMVRRETKQTSLKALKDLLTASTSVTDDLGDSAISGADDSSDSAISAQAHGSTDLPESQLPLPTPLVVNLSSDSTHNRLSLESANTGIKPDSSIPEASAERTTLLNPVDVLPAPTPTQKQNSSFNYSFLFACVTSISATLAGGALLALGVLMLNAALIAAGAVLVTTGIGSGIAAYTLFAEQKAPTTTSSTVAPGQQSTSS